MFSFGCLVENGTSSIVFFWHALSQQSSFSQQRCCGVSERAFGVGIVAVQGEESFLKSYRFLSLQYLCHVGCFLRFGIGWLSEVRTVLWVALDGFVFCLREELVICP